MAHALDLAAAWIKQTGIGAPMTATPWLWPLCETLHFIGLALLIGVAGLFDLRMLGFVRRVSLASVMDLRPWAAPTPLRLKFAGGISLASWFAVLYFGRMLPFIGNAF
jgi:hypothetical protein